jgi:hypothetical protein
MDSGGPLMSLFEKMNKGITPAGAEVNGDSSKTNRAIKRLSDNFLFVQFLKPTLKPPSSGPHLYLDLDLHLTYNLSKNKSQLFLLMCSQEER